MKREGIDIIKASAGSGKTYTLARTYISNLIGVPTGDKVVVNGKEQDCFKLRTMLDYHRHILAITFTNKATNEMKERIIAQLFKLGKGEGDYVEDFKLMFKYDSMDDVSLAARRVLSAILFDYGSFNVSTIDSFFQNILRNFAREVDRDYNYDLELDEDYATGVAVHDFLMDLGGTNSKQKAIDDWVREFISTNILNKRTWNFFGKNSSDNLKKFATIIYKEFFREHHQEIIDYLSDIGSGSGKSRVLQFRQQLITHRNLRKQSFEDAPAEIKTFLEECGLTVAEMDSRSPMYKIIQGDFSPFEKSLKTLRKYSKEDDALRKNVLLNRFSSMVSDEKSQEFKSMLAQTFEHYDKMTFLNSVIDNIWSLGLLGKIDEKLEQYRKDTNSIMIADTNELIGKVLDCGATFIYEHAGTMFNNYMIDEFQDTSHKQYDNFKPLLKESIANGYVNLIIGDEKQSIYRFRNSDPSMLREEIEKDFVSNSWSLETNYRSFPAIVKFNNSFFESIIDFYRCTEPQFKSLDLTYKNIKQHTFKDSHEGFVNINFVPYEGRSDKPAREQIVQAMPHYINALRERGYAMKDIAILVNKKKEGNAVVEQILEYNDVLGDDNHPQHIDVISAESLLLKNSPSIRLIISVLQFLEITQYQLEEDNPISEDRKDPFRSFMRKRVSEQRRYKILHDFEAKLQRMPNNVDAGKVLLSSFEEDLRSINELPLKDRLELYSTIAKEVMPDPAIQLTNLVNIVDRIIDKYILPSTTGGNTKIENSFLLSFMNVVLDFSRQRNGGTVKEFLNFWEEKKNKLAVSSPSDADAVSVMTIHKSKGLEFKCVIIPFANWDLISLDDIFWIKKENWLKAGPIEDIGANDDTILPPLIPVAPDALKKASLLEDEFNDESEKSLIDNLNKLYVAFTRPKEELHVFSIIKRKEFDGNKEKIAEVNNSTHLLLKFLLSNKEKGVELFLGEESIVCGTTSDEEPAPQMQVFNFKLGKATVVDSSESDTEANHRIMPTYYMSHTKMPVRISIPGISGSIKGEGVRMHELLRLVNSAADFDFAIHYGAANGLFDGNKYWTQQRVENVFKAVADDETIMSWFAPENVVYNERNISYPRSQGSDDHEHRRPDRIIRRPNGEIMVIDYKFGFKTDEDTINAHKTKVKEYISLLNCLGYKNISGYIWYLRSNKVVTI